MKRIASLLVLWTSIPVFSQPVPEWTSPTGNDSLRSGWLTLQVLSSGAPINRFYEVDLNSIRVMDGHYSTSVAIAIPFEPNEVPPWGLPPFIQTSPDMSGDGLNDIVINRYDLMAAIRGFRVVNSITGQTIYDFDDPGYSYSLWSASDVDNDGFIEMVVRRSAYPAMASNPYEYHAYQTSGVSTSTGGNPSSLPGSVRLQQNFPNPFNPVTTIQFELPSSEPATLEIFDAAGRLVRVVDLGNPPPGSHEVIWDGRNNQGVNVSTGVYFYQLRVDGSSLAKKMILLK